MSYNTLMPEKKKVISVMGGGTGTHTVLSALKRFSDFDLKAIVAMTDDGGSTGALRSELGVLPPGDIRQCLVALSEAPETVRELFNYRFDNGSLKGHSFGNLFLSAFEKVLGSFDKSVQEISKIIKLRGEIVPVTLDNVNLKMALKNGAVLKGERNITPAEVIQPIGIKKFSIQPKPKLNPRAKKAILESDAIIIGPGNLYTSLIPLFLVPGTSEALEKTKAKIILVVNLVTKFGQTDGFSVFDFTREIEKYLGLGVIDKVVFNTKMPKNSVLERYFRLEKSKLIIFRLNKKNLPMSAKRVSKNSFVFDSKEFFGGDLVSNGLNHQVKSDALLRRNLIRHHPKKLAEFLIKLIK